MATTAHSGVPAKAPSRKDLSGPALRTFFRIADAWDLKEAEQMKLLGLDSRSTFQTWKRGAVAAIPKDALERISYVMGALLQRLAAVRGRLSLCADQAAAAKWWLSMPM
ncbi:hypothetical protein FHS93_004006, partial [Sphingobium francense]|uniref:antitoxin Xre-like helix-turn-helix domain-containing protein n=1 Tax=Sphingobium indicum TaxID=332055 RepID=UPI00179DAA7A